MSPMLADKIIAPFTGNGINFWQLLQLIIQLNPRITRITLTIAQSAICLRRLFNNPIDVVYPYRAKGNVFIFFSITLV